MSLLRFASLVVLSLWIGGLAVLGGLAAPTIFTVLEAHDPAAGRTLAGLVFGAVFDRFQHVSWILGALLFGLLGTRALLGPRPRRTELRMGLILVMVGASLMSGLMLAPRIDEIRTTTSGTVAALPDSDPRKAAFGRLHATSNVLALVTLAAGLGLLWAEMKDPH